MIRGALTPRFDGEAPPARFNGYKLISMEGDFKDGIRVVTVSSWQEFQHEAEDLHSKRGFVWRGQRQDWTLQANFDREVPTTSNQERNEKLAAHLAKFRSRMEKSFPGTLPDD